MRKNTGIKILNNFESYEQLKELLSDQPNKLFKDFEDTKENICYFIYSLAQLGDNAKLQGEKLEFKHKELLGKLQSASGQIFIDSKDKSYEHSSLKKNYKNLTLAKI